jgi:outer membrane protein assembly factor BamB
MTRPIFLSLGLAASSLIAQPAITPLHWPDKNGPTANGIVPEADAKRLPLTWDEASGKNIVWKTPLENVGHSTPVIGGDMIWFTSATEDGHKQFLYGIDRHTGKVVHHKLIFSNDAPEELGNPLNNYAAPSPLLDEDALYVHFGTYGTVRIDPRTAEIVWQRRDIHVRHFRGPGSSPVVYQNLLILTFDGIDQQFTIALDKKTGATVWKTPRTTDYGDIDPETGKPKRDGDFRKAYGTPTFAEVDGKTQMISIGSCAGFGYDPLTGKELWTITFKNMNAAPRTLVMPGMAIVNTGSEGAKMLGLKLDGKMSGDITASHIAWTREKRNASESCPLLLDGVVYQITRGGIVSAFKAATGEDIWEERLPGQHLPSPIAAGDRLYFSNDRGETHVIKAGPKFEILAKNSLTSDPITASPAVADGALYIRTKVAIYRIEEKK